MTKEVQEREVRQREREIRGGDGGRREREKETEGREIKRDE